MVAIAPRHVQAGKVSRSVPPLNPQTRHHAVLSTVLAALVMQAPVHAGNLSGTATLRQPGLLPPDAVFEAVLIDGFTTEAQARDAVAAMGQDFDVIDMREGSLDELDAAMAELDIDGTFHAVWVAVTAASGASEFVAIVEEV